jgi:hypothetical protein
MGITGRQRGRHVFPEGVSGSARAYAADGVIQQLSGTHALTKTGTAGAFTLAAPASDGMRLTIVNRSAFAHVITATGLLDDGTAVAPKNTATFAAFPGAVLDLVAAGLKWNVASKNAVTVA